MEDSERRTSYAGLWVFALAFGWIEGAVVVYLREIYQHEINYVGGVQFPLVSLPAHLVWVEIAREACTLVLLGAVAWLVGRRLADRIGAFLLAFGIWDLAYYGVLRFVLGWPDTLTTWDILFLIPLPWVAPVWAPATVAALFVIVGSYLFWTADRRREYSRFDAAILVLSALAVIAAFLVEWRVVLDRQVPQQFPAWLFWTGVVAGTAWFLRVERRATPARLPAQWVGVRVRTIVPELPQIVTAHGEADVERLKSEYAEARRRLDDAARDVNQLRERLALAGHGEVAEEPQEFFQ